MYPKNIQDREQNIIYPTIQSIDQKQTTYKSVLGGILTLTIFAASLAYAIWVIYLWQTKQMNPKISNSKYVSDYTLLDLNQDVLKVYYWKYDDNLIDPFQNNILLPLVIYTKKNKLTTPQLIENYTTSPYGNLYRNQAQLLLIQFIILIKFQLKFLNIIQSIIYIQLIFQIKQIKQYVLQLLQLSIQLI